MCMCEKPLIWANAYANYFNCDYFNIFRLYLYIQLCQKVKSYNIFRKENIFI